MKFKNQSELFEYIWDTRPHISEISGDYLLPKGHFQWHWQFILSGRNKKVVISKISSCCLGRCKSAYGYIYLYK